MGQSERISHGELRALLRIAGETAELPRDQAIRRRHIVESLCKLLGAPAGLVFELGSNPRGGFAVDGTFQSVGLEESQRAIIEPYVHHGHPLDPTVRNVVTLPGEHVTVCRHHFVSDGDWYRSEHFEAVRKPADLDHQLYSRVMLPNGKVLGVGIQRALGEKPFTLKE